MTLWLKKHLAWWRFERAKIREIDCLSDIISAQGKHEEAVERRVKAQAAYDYYWNETSGGSSNG